MRSRTIKCLIALTIVSTFILPACTRKGPGNEPQTTTNANLKIMWWGPQERHDATLKALDLYKQKNPGITFTPEYTSWDGYWSKLTVLAASKTIPDILQMDAAYIGDYVSKGQLADISDVDLAGIVDQKILDNIKINGKMYGVPLSNNGQGMAFNKTDLTAAGVKLPFKNWTWDDFFAFAEEGKAKLPKGKYAINDYTNMWDYYEYYQTSYGKGPVFNGNKLNLDRDLWIAFYKKFEQYRKSGVVPPASQALAFKENDPKADPMASGVVMTRGASVGSVNALAALMPGKVEVVNNPGGPTSAGWAQATIFFSVGSNSKYKDVGKDFAKWFISDKDAGKALGTTRGIPISNEIYKEIEPNLKDTDKYAKRLLDVVIDKAGPFYPATPGWTDFTTKYKSETEALMFGRQSVEDTYAKLIKLGQDTEAKLGGK